MIRVGPDPGPGARRSMTSHKLKNLQPYLSPRKHSTSFDNGVTQKTFRQSTNCVFELNFDVIKPLQEAFSIIAW